MPSYYTHFYFANKVVEHLSYAAKATVDLYPDAYRLGALGFDLFRPMGRLRAELDYKYIYELFEHTGNYIYESGSKSQLAYTLGAMTHYVLDSRMNPYIFYLVENGVPEYFAGKKGFLTAKNIRDSIDAHIKTKAPEYTNSIVFMPNPEVVDDIAEMFEKGISSLVKYKVRASKIANCLQNYKIPAIEPYELPLYDYMNRQKYDWLTVRNGDWVSDMSVDELLEKLILIAVKMIDGMVMRVRSGEPLDKKWFSLNYLGVMSQDTD